MRTRQGQFWLAVITVCTLQGVVPSVHAQWVNEGQAPEGRWTAGVRAGFSPITQEMFAGTDTSVGPVLNFLGMYGLNKWMNVGLMLEWNRYGVSTEGTRDIGTVNTAHQTATSRKATRVAATPSARPNQAGCSASSTLISSSSPPPRYPAANP